MGVAVGGVFGEDDLIAPESRRIMVLDVNWFGFGAVDVDECLQTFPQGGPEVVAMPEPARAILRVNAGIFTVANRRRKRDHTSSGIVSAGGAYCNRAPV